MHDSSYIKRLKERLRQRPGSRLALSLAEEFRKQDMMESAISVLVDCIRKNPDFYAARLTLGRWYLSSEMLPEARNVLSELVQREPVNLNARKMLAEVYVRLADHDSAAEEYAKVLEINPFDTAAASYIKSPVHAGKRLETAETGYSGANLDKVAERLGSFLELIKVRFAGLGAEEVYLSGDSVVERLNSFLKAIKRQFEREGDYPSGDNVVDRLNSFLKAIKQHFAGERPEGIFQAGDNRVERLEVFLETIKKRFAVQRSEISDKDIAVRRLNNLLGAINTVFGAADKDRGMAATEV